jgi:hypothetical protein
VSGTLPATPAPNSVRITSYQPTLVSVAHSLKRQARTRGAQRWAAVLGYPNMTRATFAPLWAFLIAQRGQYDTFQAPLPGYETPQGTATGTPLAKGAAAAGASSIPTDGWTISITGILKAGDFVKFSAHTKVYMVTADANSNGAGEATLSIQPKLVAAVADNEALTVNSVPFTWQLASDQVEQSTGLKKIINAEVSLLEAY